MSDLIERAREASTLKYQYHTIHVPTILERLAAELERLAKENAALRADAERLQYLLDKRSVTIDTMLHGNGCTAHTADELRAAIDSARAKESGDG